MAKRKRASEASAGGDELISEHEPPQEMNDESSSTIGYANRGSGLACSANGKDLLSERSPRKVRRTGRLLDELTSGATAPLRPKIKCDPEYPARRRGRSKGDLFHGRAGGRINAFSADLSSDSERHGGNEGRLGRKNDSQEWDYQSDVPLPKRYRILSHVQAAPPAYPRSAYQGWQPPLPFASEENALHALIGALNKQHADATEPPEHNFVHLENFSAYRKPLDPRHAGELVGLEKLQVHKGANDGLLFDGFLCVGDERYFVKGVPFKILTVDGYGDVDVASLEGSICIESSTAKRLDIWYQLENPAPEYERFFKPFIWLAEFTKHFVDYLLEMDEVTLEDFRFCFGDWLQRRHAGKLSYQRWLDICGLRDFRTTVCAHVSYIWNECAGVDACLLKHPIWGEVDPVNLRAIPHRANHHQNTVVTPFAYDMFKRMYFGDFLKRKTPISGKLEQQITAAKAELDLAPFHGCSSQDTGLLTPQTTRNSSPVAASSFTIGDVVTLDSDLDGVWQSSSDTWYAYVQTVQAKADKTLLDILWLYQPHDTTLGKAYYPYGNELFLSDNCECGKTAIDARQVRGKVQVSWTVKDPALQSGLFVRQKFRTVEEEGTYDFVSLQPSDFCCRCESLVSDFEDCRRKYEIGDTVLVLSSGKGRNDGHLTPSQVVDFDLLSEQVILRRMNRKTEKDCNAAPNELIMTDSTFPQQASRIIRKCHIRIFSAADIAEGLPIGYDRGGAGDFYFIVQDDSSMSSNKISEETSDPQLLPSIGKGLDLTAPVREKLTGMGIFCGGGNFDRGFEDAGCADFRYAVDWAEKALHSYRANAPVPDNVNFFLGSVNEYVSQAMKGSEDAFIATPGEIGLLTAGSPCPGFSSLQPDKQSPDSLRNASMVASVVSFADLFCPKYCVLENVVNMTTRMDGKHDQNVFAQVLAAFVAMGYQVQQFLMDAWSHGSSQSRTRVFIVASAPGLPPLPLPQLTHDHPKDSTVKLRGLGMATNGKRFGMRRDEYTPYPVTTAAKATSDLPDLGDAQVRVCPKFPDHVMPSEESAVGRERIAAVPNSPHGMGLRQAATKGLLSGEPLEFISKGSSVRATEGSTVYSRVYPDRLFPTVTTCLRLACGVTGRTLHWSQDRSLTVMELRRAQGFLDHEVIIGSRHQQVKIIGNSVDRKLAFALGLCLRESWLNSSTIRPGLVQQRTNYTILSPTVTEEDGDSEESQQQRTQDGEEGTSEQGDSDESSELFIRNDRLRAGTSAVANLEPGERAALQEGEIATTQPLSSGIAVDAKVNDLAVGDSDDENGRNVLWKGNAKASPRNDDQKVRNQPTAYVEIFLRGRLKGEVA